MVEIEVSDQVATITIEDCPALTRHSQQAGATLRDAIRSCGDRDNLKVIVLRAKGPDFCSASAPSKLPRNIVNPPDWTAAYASSTGLYQTLCYSKKVTITAVQGVCADAGSLLVLCSDLTVAAADATFHSPFHALPEANFVLTALTMRLNRAKSWMLGSPLDAAGALDSGLINRIAPADVVSEARTLARSVAKVPLDGIAMSKLMLETCLDAQGVGQDFDMAGFYAASMPVDGTSNKASGS